MQDQINNKLDSNWFPWIKEPPPNSCLAPGSPSLSGGSRPATWAAGDSSSSAAPPLPTRKKPSWASRKVGTPSSAQSIDTLSPAVGKPGAAAAVDLRRNGPRILLFVIGGVIYSELRHITQLQGESSRECYIGSTHIWTPDSFVEALKFGNGGDRRRGSSGGAVGAPFYEFQRPPPRPRRGSDPARSRGDRSVAPRIQSRNSSRSEDDRPSPAARNSPPRERGSQSSRRRGEPISDQMSRMRMGEQRPPIPERSRSSNTLSNGSSSDQKKKGWFGF